jgi:TPR repeat protein
LAGAEPGLADAAPVKALSPQGPSPSDGEITALVARGDSLIGIADIASARLFYERAAEAGDARAALRLGETYDPFFLAQARLGARGNLSLALHWYRRARDLGASEAEVLLRSVESKENR